MYRVMSNPLISRVNRDSFSTGAVLRKKISRIFTSQEANRHVATDTFCRNAKACTEKPKKIFSNESIKAFLEKLLESEGGESYTSRLNKENIKYMTEALKEPFQRELLLKVAPLKEFQVYEIVSVCSSAQTPNEAKLISKALEDNKLQEKIQVLQNSFAKDWKSAIDEGYSWPYKLNLFPRMLEQKLGSNDVDLDRIFNLQRSLKSNRVAITKPGSNEASDASISTVFTTELFKSMKVIDNELILYTASKDKLNNLGQFLSGITRITETIDEKNSQILKQNLAKIESPKTKHLNLQALILMAERDCDVNELVSAINCINKGEKFAEILKNNFFRRMRLDIPNELANRISFNEKSFTNLLLFADANIKFRRGFRDFVELLKDPARNPEKTMKLYSAELMKKNVFEGQEINYQNFMSVKQGAKVVYGHR